MAKESQNLTEQAESEKNPTTAESLKKQAEGKAKEASLKAEIALETIRKIIPDEEVKKAAEHAEKAQSILRESGSTGGFTVKDIVNNNVPKEVEVSPPLSKQQ
nr:hypothetical protein [Desulfobacula sp.]